LQEKRLSTKILSNNKEMKKKFQGKKRGGGCAGTMA